MRSKRSSLTWHELKVMKLVWQRDSATVRDMYIVLLERRRIAYTAVITLMKILESKGYLKKRRQHRALVYQPAQPQDHVIGRMVQEFMERIFNGSVEPLLVQLVKSHYIRVGDLKRSFVRGTEEGIYRALARRNDLNYAQSPRR